MGSVYVAYAPDLAFPGAAETVGAFADPAAVRERFDEARWRAGTWCALVSTAAFGCLAWALVLSGRITAAGGS